MKVSSTLGQIVIGAAHGDFVATEGFQQGDMDKGNALKASVNVITKQKEAVVEVVAYPNPVVDQLNIDLGDAVGEFRLLRLVNAEGRLAIERAVTDQRKIEMRGVADLPATTYYLQAITNDDQLITITSVVVVPH